MRVLATTLGTLALWCAPAGAIVGGQPVPEGELPAVANVSVAGGTGGCSGTLIAPSWVMTAAHCGSLTSVLTSGVIPSTTPFPAAAYSVTLNTVYADGRGGEQHGVKRIVIADDYGIAEGAGSDVALLELDSASKVAPVRIAAVGERGSWRPGDLATIAGFGLTKEDGEAPDQMQRAQVPVVGDPDCVKAYPEFDAGTMVCAGYPEGGTDTCQGDSGGPLFADVSGTTRLVGATSFGDGCAQAGKPGVYARVAEGKLRDFVKKIVPAAFAAEPEPASSPTGPSSQPGATPAKKPSRAACRKARKVKRSCGKRKTKKCRKARATVRRCRG